MGITEASFKLRLIRISSFLAPQKQRKPLARPLSRQGVHQLLEAPPNFNGSLGASEGLQVCSMHRPLEVPCSTSAKYGRRVSDFRLGLKVGTVLC